MCTHGEKISAEGCSVGRGGQKRHVCKGGEGSLTQRQGSTLAVVGCAVVGCAEALWHACSGGVCRGPAAGTQVLGCSGIMGTPEQSDQTTARRGWHKSKVQKTSDGCPQRRPHTWASGKHGGGRRQP